MNMAVTIRNRRILQDQLRLLVKYPSMPTTRSSRPTIVAIPVPMMGSGSPRSSSLGLKTKRNGIM
jgi:hypothetical protein